MYCWSTAEIAGHTGGGGHAGHGSGGGGGQIPQSCGQLLQVSLLSHTLFGHSGGGGGGGSTEHRKLPLDAGVIPDGRMA